jgi:hypothetical protein
MAPAPSQSHTGSHPCATGLARDAGEVTLQSPKDTSHSWQGWFPSCPGLEYSLLFIVHCIVGWHSQPTLIVVTFLSPKQAVSTLGWPSVHFAKVVS